MTVWNIGPICLNCTFQKGIISSFFISRLFQGEVVGDVGEDSQETGSLGRVPSRLSILFALRWREVEDFQDWQ